MILYEQVASDWNFCASSKWMRYQNNNIDRVHRLWRILNDNIHNMFSFEPISLNEWIRSVIPVPVLHPDDTMLDKTNTGPEWVVWCGQNTSIKQCFQSNANELCWGAKHLLTFEVRYSTDPSIFPGMIWEFLHSQLKVNKLLILILWSISASQKWNGGFYSLFSSFSDVRRYIPIMCIIEIHLESVPGTKDEKLFASLFFFKPRTMVIWL